MSDPRNFYVRRPLDILEHSRASEPNGLLGERWVESYEFRIPSAGYKIINQRANIDAQGHEHTRRHQETSIASVLPIAEDPNIDSVDGGAWPVSRRTMNKMRREKSGLNSPKDKNRRLH
jgi:hypothetical protein